MENIKKLYTSSGKCDYKQQYKANIEVEMIYTPKRFTKNSPMLPGTSATVRNPSARKSFCLFTEFLDVKKKLMAAG